MLAIAINHLSYLMRDLGMEGRGIPTLTVLGYSSAAELFFLLSGYMVGLVYVGRADASRRLISRAATIYLVNLATFLTVLALALSEPPALSSVTFIGHSLEDPARGIVDFALFRQHPILLDVLFYYVVLMIAAVPVVALLKRFPAAAMACSVALYLAVQFDPQLNIPVKSATGSNVWSFNPFAWQLLFFGGILAGRHRLYDRFAALVAKPMVLGALCLLFLLAFLLKLAELGDIIVIPLEWIDKTGVAPLRLVHALLVLGLLTAVAGFVQRVLPRNPLVAMVARVGRNTLQCFAASVVATYALAALWLRFAPTYLGYLACAAVMLVLVCLTALLREGWRGRFRRQATAASDTVMSPSTSLASRRT